jgi:hypothetical protein
MREKRLHVELQLPWRLRKIMVVWAQGWALLDGMAVFHFASIPNWHPYHGHSDCGGSVDCVSLAAATLNA